MQVMQHTQVTPSGENYVTVSLRGRRYTPP